MTYYETPSPEPQECQGCCRDFPADDPMLEVADAGTFCSWGCVAEYAADQTHCLTHDELVEAYDLFARNFAAIEASVKETE